MKITFLVSGTIRSNFTYRALAFAKSLHKLGHNVSIIAPKADKYNNFSPEAIDAIAGVRILQPFQFATKRLVVNLVPYLFGAARMALREKPDMIIVYKPTPVSIVGFVVRFFRKTSIVVDIDDLGSEVMKIEGHPWYQRKLVVWSENFAVRHADMLVVASHFLSDKYRSAFPCKPIHIMPNGVESDWFGAPAFSEEKKQIIFMGSINRKNILEPLFEALPDIIKEHPRLRVVIIGAGRDLEYFKRKGQDLNIAANVAFKGWLDIADARAQLYMGDIGYNYMPDEPTTKAANNMKVSQYMARGVVPLVSAIGDLPAAVDFGAAGYICEADSVPALTGALRHALADKDRMHKAKRARDFAMEKFNWDHLAEGFSGWATHKK